MIGSLQWEKVNEIIQALYRSAYLQELQEAFLCGIESLVPYELGMFCMIQEIGGRFIPGNLLTIKNSGTFGDATIDDIWFEYSEKCAEINAFTTAGRWRLTKAYRSSDTEKSLLSPGKASGGGLLVAEAFSPAAEILLIRSEAHAKAGQRANKRTSAKNDKITGRNSCERACERESETIGEGNKGDLTESEMEILQVLGRHLEICFERGLMTKGEKDVAKWLGTKAWLQELGLTRTEAEIAMHAVYGHSNPDICQLFEIAPNTLKKNLTRIYRKLDVKGMPGMIQYISKMMSYSR